MRVKLSACPLLSAVRSCAAQVVWRGFQRLPWGLLLIKSLMSHFLLIFCAVCGNGAQNRAKRFLRRGEFCQIFYKKWAAVHFYVYSGFCYTKKQERLLTFLLLLDVKITPALPATPAHSRCSGTCRWSSAQRSGRTLPQWRRCSGGSCTAQCLPDAWGAWAFPCAQPCRFQ